MSRAASDNSLRRSRCNPNRRLPSRTRNIREARTRPAGTPQSQFQIRMRTSSRPKSSRGGQDILQASRCSGRNKKSRCIPETAMRCESPCSCICILKARLSSVFEPKSRASQKPAASLRIPSLAVKVKALQKPSLALLRNLSLQQDKKSTLFCVRTSGAEPLSSSALRKIP